MEKKLRREVVALHISTTAIFMEQITKNDYSIFRKNNSISTIERMIEAMPGDIIIPRPKPKTNNEDEEL
ncbi:hypothetical protein [Cytophaga aurantiaca]|uniref:hypothetical protein n=1 Tax=Cytophaga aurantiaca TaxID=29530 RepID=UPI000368E90D|nr:hypothetical protein [Cytophaga aurantiaca]